MTRTALIPLLNTITVAEITTTIRGNDSEVLINEFDGMAEECVVNLINIQTVAKQRVQSYVTHFSDERMSEVFEAIKFVFGFDK